MTPVHLRVGRFQVYGFREGTFAIDGGAMYGVVPRVLWEKLQTPDDRNRIQLGLNSLLIDVGEARILVDTGAGAFLKKSLVEHYAIRRDPGLDTALRELGYAPESIDFVINTHLHFDHCGGNTRLSPDGEFEPAFPNARFVLQSREWKSALNPVSRDKPSYLASTFACLENSEQLILAEGETEILPGLRVLPSPGHTSGHQCVLLQSQGEGLLFLGDLVPTTGHLGLSYIMSFDLYPLRTYETKRRLLTRAAKSGWVVATSHDPEAYFGRVALQAGKFRHLPIQ